MVQLSPGKKVLSLRNRTTHKADPKVIRQTWKTEFMASFPTHVGVRTVVLSGTRL